MHVHLNDVHKSKELNNRIWPNREAVGFKANQKFIHHLHCYHSDYCCYLDGLRLEGLHFAELCLKLGARS